MKTTFLVSFLVFVSLREQVSGLSIEDCKNLLSDVDKCYKKITVFGDGHATKFSPNATDIDVLAHCK